MIIIKYFKTLLTYFKLKFINIIFLMVLLVNLLLYSIIICSALENIYSHRTVACMQTFLY